MYSSWDVWSVRPAAVAKDQFILFIRRHLYFERKVN